MKDLQLRKVSKHTPFATVYQLSFEQLKQGLYAVRAFENGSVVSEEKLASAFFFRYEPNFYGLHAELEGEALLITAVELLECLSPQFKHPFVHFVGVTEEDALLLESIEQVQMLWNSPSL